MPQVPVLEHRIELLPVSGGEEPVDLPLAHRPVVVVLRLFPDLEPIGERVLEGPLFLVLAPRREKPFEPVGRNDLDWKDRLNGQFWSGDHPK